jgi:hypothetical protein
MEVVINEFEVVSEGPAPATSNVSPGGPGGANSEEKPELEEKLRQVQARCQRVRAH